MIILTNWDISSNLKFSTESAIILHITRKRRKCCQFNFDTLCQICMLIVFAYPYPTLPGLCGPGQSPFVLWLAVGSDQWRTLAGDQREEEWRRRIYSYSSIPGHFVLNVLLYRRALYSQGGRLLFTWLTDSFLSPIFTFIFNPLT